MNYYNEFDPKAAAWLRELIKAKLIPEGKVDERSICDVKANDLEGFTQCHFFAGIAGWARALELAGWSKKRKVWTGSAPCQPWSIANVAHGGARGREDDRHLWPFMFGLVRELVPDVIFGEQVVRAIRLGWLDEMSRDLESKGYAVGTTVLRSDALGFSDERKRLFWVADSRGTRREGHQSLECVSVAATAALAVNGDPAVRARRALAGDFSGLLPCNGLSVQLERDALKGYGNAINVEVAAKFIQAYDESRGALT